MGGKQRGCRAGVWGRGSDLGIVSVWVVLEAWERERAEGGEVLVPDEERGHEGCWDVKQLPPVEHGACVFDRVFDMC